MPAKRKDFTKREIQEILKRYNRMESLMSLSALFGCRASKIRGLLVEKGIKIRSSNEALTSEQLATNKKYSMNENYFKKIDNHDKAYWLGFLYADGYILDQRGVNNGKRKGLNIGLTLNIDDSYHVDNFLHEIRCNVKPRIRTIKLKGKEFLAYGFEFGSVKMGEDLIKLGCTPRKSLTLEYPTGLPDKYFSSFMRGYFDGDGCVCLSSDQENYSVTMMGTFNFLSSIKEMLLKNNIESVKISGTGSNAFVMGISRSSFKKFYNLLYKKSRASYLLDRKRDKFKKICEINNFVFPRSIISKLFDLM